MFANRKNVWLGIVAVVTLVCGLLQLLPSVFLERAVKKSGNEFLLTQVTHHGDAAIFYLPSTREVLDGHFPPIDLHIPENRKFLFLRPPLPQLLFAPILFIADNPSHAYMAAGFLFTILMFGLFYWTGVTFFRSRLGALLFAAVGVLTPAAVELPQAFFSPQLFMDIIGKNFLPVVRTPIHQLFLARIEDPLLTLWLYILVFMLLYRFYRMPSKARGVALGVAAGLLLYVYLYYWLFSVTLLGLLFFYGPLAKKDQPIRPWLYPIALIGLLAIPYILNFLVFRQLPQASELIARVGFESGFGFRLSVWPDYLAYIFFGACAVLVFQKRNPMLAVFFIASLIAMVLMWNLQLFVGWNIQPDHWPKAFGLPLFILIATLIAEVVRVSKDMFPDKRVALLFLCVWVLLAAGLIGKKVLNAAVFIHPGNDWISDYSFPRPIIESWDWLNKNVPKESVVVTPSYITGSYLTGNTSLNPYLPGYNSIAPTRVYEDRFLAMHKLFGTSPERLRQLLVYHTEPQAACPGPCNVHTALNIAKAPSFLYAQIYNTAMSKFDALTVEKVSYAIPQEKIDDLLTRYAKLKLSWADFSGDYVYVGPWERELSPAEFSGNSNLEEVYKKDGIEIYRVR